MEPGWHTGNSLVCGDIMSHHRTSANDRIVPNGQAGEDDGAGTDQYAPFYHHAAAKRGLRGNVAEIPNGAIVVDHRTVIEDHARPKACR